MPYTLSHAVMSIPFSWFSRGRIPFAALAIGSMSPDFPYLIALKPTDAPGHSLTGVLLYCFIPALLLALLWYRWLEKPTHELWHLPVRSKEQKSPPVFSVIIGVLIGAYSHVIWDATSHVDGFFVQSSGFWQQVYFSLPLYKWNQYASGVSGLVVLSLWYLINLMKNRKEPYIGHPFIGGVVYMVSVSTVVAVANISHESGSVAQYAVHSALAVITGGFVAVCVYALVVPRINRKPSLQ